MYILKGFVTYFVTSVTYVDVATYGSYLLWKYYLQLQHYSVFKVTLAVWCITIYEIDINYLSYNNLKPIFSFITI